MAMKNITYTAFFKSQNKIEQECASSISIFIHRGATPLTLSSSDQAVAIVTGDIKVGEYQFLLTVTDREGQSSSQKLKVTVKMSEF